MNASTLVQKLCSSCCNILCDDGLKVDACEGPLQKNAETVKAAIDWLKELEADLQPDLNSETIAFPN